MYIASVGASPQIGEIEPFCDFFPVLSCPFFSFQKPHYLVCYNFDKLQAILIIVGRNVAKKVNNQMMLYFPISFN